MVRRRSILTFAAAVSAIAVVGGTQEAQAGAFAFSTIQVADFMVRSVVAGPPTTLGAQLDTPTNIIVLSASNSQSSQATLNGVVAPGIPALPPPGVIQQACIGNCAVFTPPGAASFTYQAPFGTANVAQAADQLSGTIVTQLGLGGGGADSNTAAQTQLLGDANSNAFATNALNAAFTFTVLTNKAIGISFDALTRLVAGLDGLGTAAQASSSFEVKITTAGGTTVFDWKPDGTTAITGGTVLSAGVNLNNSLSQGIKGFTADTGLLAGHFEAVTGILLAGVNYNFNISQNDTVNATSVPEPMSLALFGISLLGFGIISHKRRRRA